MTKKGRQRGAYKSKALRVAASRLQWDDTDEDLQFKYNVKSYNDGYKRCSEMARLRNSMVAQMLAPTEGDEMRLRRMCNPVSNVGNGFRSKDEIKVNRHSVGWVIWYEMEEDLERNHVKSLSRLCIDSLAKALPTYIEQIEFDNLKLALGSLGPHALAILSACVEVDDNLALLLGQHADVHCLVLKSKSNKLTDKAMIGLTPRLVNDYVDQDWEETTDDPGAVVGCMNLRRLELLDAQAISFEAISNFFQFSPCITHLSISNSFDSSVGPRLLLDDSSNIFSFLPRLQLLDLSHCSWLDDSILAHAFSRLHRESHVVLKTLTLVSVAGCSKVTKACLQKLNQAFFPSKPVLCTEVYMHSIVNRSTLTDPVSSNCDISGMYKYSSSLDALSSTHWWDFVQ